MRRLRNQAQLCTRTLPLGLAMYLLLMLLGRVQASAPGGFLTQAAAADHSTPGGEMLCSEVVDNGDKSYTNEWDEDDKIHSPLPRFQAAYPDVDPLLPLQKSRFVFVSLDSRSCFCRGPPRA